MKNSVLFIFFCCCLSSCNNKQKVPYWEHYNGDYRYVAAYFDEPIDINWDGVKHTNLYDELTDSYFCNAIQIILSSEYAAKILFIPDDETGTLDYQEPEWWFNENSHTSYGCYDKIQKGYTVIAEGNSLIPTGDSNDWVYQYYPDMPLSEIQSIKIENDTLKIHVLKPFFTSDTVYQTVNAYFHLVKSQH